jgi:uncharacterized membrane protein
MAFDPYRRFRLFLVFGALVGILASLTLIGLLIYVAVGRVWHLH